MEDGSRIRNGLIGLNFKKKGEENDVMFKKN